MAVTLPAFDPSLWLHGRGWRVADFQRAAWEAQARGESGLIHAPTGSGKTLAAFLGVLSNSALTQGPVLLWITPMRALAADTAAGLAAICAELRPDWRVGVRSGDTAAGERARQRRALPQVLVTTPESASLLLSYADLRPQWRGLRAIVVDEWHELLGSKRGVQTELVLAHLRTLAPGVRTWGLSATLGNLDEALAVLLGPAAQGRLIGDTRSKAIEIRTLLPAAVERFAWGGHMGLQLLPQVVDALAQAPTSLVFANTRAQAERWFDALSMAAPELPIALHHGSLDPALRRAAEDGLRDGRLRAVVATSSLDLGVDFAPVAQVIQIGGPKGVARLLQRAGRSGHRPDAVARLLCVPTHALEIAEFAAARHAIAAGRIEARRPLRHCLDVLAQHVVTLALTGSVCVDALRAEIETTHAYAGLGDAAWQWVLDFVMHGGSALSAYPQYRKVVVRDGVLQVDNATVARRHRMAIGTISADSQVRVQVQRGAVLGHVEESFVARLKPGDGFLFAGRALTLVRVREMTAWVRAGRARSLIPRWQGGKMPLSSELAHQLAMLLAHGDDGPEYRALAPLLELQARWSGLPAPGRWLIERSRSREGDHLFVYPLAGRHVHEGLSALLAYRLSRQTPLSCSFSVNDYGFEIVARALPQIDGPTLRRLLDPAGLDADLLASLNASEMARRRFREIARIAGLVFEGFPGAHKSVRQVQASSGLIYDVLERYDPGHHLRQQALQEVLEHQLDLQRLRETLVQGQHAELVLCETERFTPLAFPLWAERIASRLSSEDLATRLRAMAGQLERAADAPVQVARPRRTVRHARA
jgi:ATP-dependent helicase Lhr and Lhr-like helicase